MIVAQTPSTGERVSPWDPQHRWIVDRDVHMYPELTNREMTTSHGYHELLKVQVKSVMEDWSGGSHPKVS